MKPFLLYTVARFAVFAACLGVAVGIFWVVGSLGGGGDVPVLWAVLLAAVMSVMISAWLLRGLREEFAATVQARADRMVTAGREREAAGDPAVTDSEAGGDRDPGQ